ncbi:MULTISPECIES: hypothetical protein [Cryobacterium]|uniref:hypothetical protein n=1 Tax=Cryobacterium TaxID=69578 RepID=UPI0015803D8F|nr:MULTISPECIES: hypothetical protein [Cryobacterium]MDY7528773.1 hypothetical protein [Cryobacterium sp. 10C2]MDY7555484.1 hypothetical protein [Cryobacterium sp. 10C3]MEB0003792.1 hypothetical protein [Cryobacterium sp. RTC2.1]MEB0201756.1 hypothetical protein [Cryobacterium sp. 5I3]MEB0285256.1 hypothetical protein [Cryobacterium sp. 10S3]
MTFLETSEAPSGFLDSPQARALLVRVIRVAFPHAQLPDTAYEKTADALIALAEKTPRHFLALSSGLASLDTLPAGAFLDLNAMDATARLRAIEQTEFFGFVRANTVLTLYNLPEVWQALGYEGASFDKGGYLHRGFNDLDWLPEPRIEEYTGELRYVEIGPLTRQVGAATPATPAAASAAPESASGRDEVTK